MKASQAIQFIGFISLGILIAGCALTPPANKAQLCAQLKRQIIYNASNLNTEARFSNAHQRAALLQHYRDCGCE